jgi:hypothetical protein
VLIIDGFKRRDSWILGSFTLACVFGLVSGVVSLFGIRKTRVLLIVPAAVPGLILNLGVGIVAFFLYAISGFPGP